MKLYWKDISVFISKLTISKLWNVILLISSYYATKIRGKAIVWGKPMTISFEPTTACNLRCPECPSGLRSFTRDTGNLKKDFFTSSIDQLKDRLLYLIFYFQGEPYINPEFLDMVSYANQQGIYTITSTNGHFLNDKNAEATVRSGLSRLIISVDGTTQDTYESYRIGGKLEVVLQGAKNIVKWKKELKSNIPHIVFQYLVVKPNEHQIEDIYKIAGEIGIDEVKLKTAQVYNYKNGNDLIPTNEKYSRYQRQHDGTYTLKHSLVNSCWKMWHSCVITWDGMVVPCCFDKDATHRLGDMKLKSFDSLWHGKEYDEFRHKLLQGRDKIDICTNCTEGCKVFF